MLSIGNRVRVTPVALMVAMIFSLAHISTAVATGTSWSATGSLANARYSYTATLFTNGKVLVAGGRVGSALAASTSAELYDTATGIWSVTGDMVNPRAYHTATLLPNGKVLLAGGWAESSGRLASAELYDPGTGSWSATGPMANPRTGHTATLLATGKVLVAGGFSGAMLSGAELYDPANGSWTATGAMANPRYDHTVTLLANGKVLVAGGANGSGVIADAELYDPGNGSWSVTGAMANPRYLYTATLLATGKVLVAGGDGPSNANLNSAELYDPGNGSWSGTGAMANTRRDHTATLLPNGKVLVAGGWGGSSTGPLASAELYDPVNSTWSVTGSMANPRYSYTATLLLTGAVLVAGGWGTGGRLDSAELYGAIDAIAPTASPARSPAANVAGWNKSDVTVTWNWADNTGGSGIDTANCTTSRVSAGEGSLLTLSATCRDVAGNTGNASATVKVDKTNPSLTPPPAVIVNATDASGAVVSNVTLGMPTVSDNLTPSPVSWTVSGIPVGNLFPTGTTTLTYTATDLAGNWTVATQAVTVGKGKKPGKIK